MFYRVSLVTAVTLSFLLIAGPASALTFKKGQVLRSDGKSMMGHRLNSATISSRALQNQRKQPVLAGPICLS